MSTIYVFQNEVPAVDSMDAADALMLYDTSSGRTKQMTGAQSQDVTLTAATSASTGTTIASYGLTTLQSSNGSVWNLDTPVAGRRKTLINTATSTISGVQASTGATITIHSTTNCVMKFNAQNASVELIGLSTTRWGLFGSTGAVTLSTST